MYIPPRCPIPDATVPFIAVAGGAVVLTCVPVVRLDHKLPAHVQTNIVGNGGAGDEFIFVNGIPIG